MSKKSPTSHHPRIAIFDLFKLISNENIVGETPGFSLTRPALRKRDRKTIFPGNEKKRDDPGLPKTLLTNTGRIGVLVASLSDHNINKIISGVELAAGKSGYQIAILNVLGKQPLSTDLVGFDGFIACCPDDRPIDRNFFDNLNKPVILIGNIEDPGDHQCVTTDYYKGAQLAVNHLIDQGCQKISMVTSELSNAAGLDKYMGYRYMLRKSAMDWQEPLIVGESSVEAGMEVAAKMIENGTLPDGVFITNDWIAAGFIKYLKKAGIDSLKVIGFGGELLCEMIEPDLCSVDFRKELSGSTALHLLYEQMGNRQLIENKVIVIEPTLAIRI